MNNRKKSLRILLLTWVFSDTITGGEARLSWNFARALANTGADVFVVSPIVEYTSPVPQNLRAYRIPCASRELNYTPGNMLKAFLFSLPIILFRRIDLIHLITGQSASPFSCIKIRPFAESVHMPWEYSDERFRADLQLDRSRKSRELGTPYMPGFLEKVWGKITYWFYRLLKVDAEGAYPSGVDLWLCTSHAIRKRMEKTHPGSVKVLVPLGYDDERYFLAQKQNTEDMFTFLSVVGTISHRKGLKYLIQAFQKLELEFPEARLRILGGGGAPETFQELRQEIKSPRIELVATFASEKLPEAYWQSSAFVLPSLGEPFGIVLLEAAACGLPLIATNAGGGPPDIVEHGTMGYLVEPADADTLYEAMKKLCSNKETAHRMGLYAAGRVRPYAWGNIARQARAAYEQVLAL